MKYNDSGDNLKLESVLNNLTHKYHLIKRFVTSKEKHNKEQLDSYASFDGYLQDLIEDAKTADNEEDIDKLLVKIDKIIESCKKNLEKIKQDIEDPQIPRIYKSKFELFQRNLKTFQANLDVLSNKLVLKKANYKKKEISEVSTTK
jgi:hypothetical protein